MSVKFRCPICKCSVYNEEPAHHFRYTHMIPQEDIINILFTTLGELDERITNLCELLEVREK